MSATMMRTLSLTVLFGWLIYASTLTDFPRQEAAYLEENRATVREMVVANAARTGKKLSAQETASEVEKEIAKGKQAAWRDWTVRAVAILLGVASVVLHVVRGGRALWFVGVTSALFVGLWLGQLASASDGIAAGYARFAAAVFSTGTLSQQLGFAVFNVVLPVLFAVAAIVFIGVALRTARKQSRTI
jgi:hypothetical protein